MQGTDWDWLRDDPSIARLAELNDRVFALAREARLETSAHPVLRDPGWVNRLRSRVAAKVTVMVIGQVSAGKSSFVNSLLGRKLLPSSDRPTDGVISVLQETPSGTPEGAERVYADGRVEPFASLKEGADFLARQHTSSTAQLRTREVRFHLDEPVLRDIRLINTPGLGDRLGAYEDVTLDYLHEDESDLIIWIFFPDSAANRSEVGLFSQALARRRNAVLGVVTRSLEDHEDDPEYDPRHDPGLAQVAEHLRTHLGSYLGDVIFYDSHTARRLVGRLRADPLLADDPQLRRQLDRCGYSQVEQALIDAAGDSRARARSVLRRAAATAAELRRAAAAAEQVFSRHVKLADSQTAAFAQVDNNVLIPVRNQVDGEIYQLADEAAHELVMIFSSAATDIIAEQFTLGASLVDAAKGMLHKATNGDRQAQALSSRLSRSIQDEVQRKLDAADFHGRVSRRAGSVIGRHMSDLASRLSVETAGSLYTTADGMRAPVDPRTVGGAGALLVDGIIGHIMATLGEVAAKSVIQSGTALASRAAIDGMGSAAVATAGRSVAGKAVSVYALVLVPLDIRKLYADFNQGKRQMAQTVTATFSAEHALHAKRIRETLLPAVDAAFEQLRSAARTAMTPPDDVSRRWLVLLESADSTSTALATLEDTFTTMAAGAVDR